MLIFAWWKIHYFQIFLIRYSLAKLVRLNYRLKPRRCPSPHHSSFSRSQVSTLRLVFCRNRFCIFDACVNRLWQSWIYDAACPCASNLCVPPYEKRKEQTQTKKREERKERQRRGKNRTTGRHNRGRASINRSEAQGVAVNSSHCFVTDREPRGQTRGRGRRVVPGGPGKLLLVSLRNRLRESATRCHRREPHVGFPRSLRATLRWITTLRRPVTLNFVTPRDLFARRLVPVARIRSGG